MRKILFFCFALILAGMACSLPNPSSIQGTLDAVQQTVKAAITEVPKTVEAAATSIGTLEAAPTQPTIAANGTIRGNLIYPASVLVAQRIVAFDSATKAEVAEVTTVQGQSQYELTVPAGDYYVVSYTLDGKLAAGYSQAVPCGLSVDCTDHSLILVHVDAGAIVENINPQDWYAPAGAFPTAP
jgi:hypothetical protein